MSDRVWNGLLGHAQILKPVSGLSVLMFAVENNQKSKYATPPGLVWSYIIRRSIVFVLAQARTKLFEDPRKRVVAGSSAVTTPSALTGERGGVREQVKPPMPKWLLAFDDKEDIREAVNLVSREIETKVGDAFLPSATSSTNSLTSPRG